MHVCNCTFLQLGLRRHRRGAQAPIKPYPLRICGALPPNSLTKFGSAGGPRIVSGDDNVKAFSKIRIRARCQHAGGRQSRRRRRERHQASRHKTGRHQDCRYQSGGQLPVRARRVRPPPAATGTTASIAPPSASAGMCAQRAARRQRPHRHSRIHLRRRQPRRSQRRRRFQPQPDMSPSVANARAEFSSPQANVAQIPALPLRAMARAQRLRRRTRRPRRFHRAGSNSRARARRATTGLPPPTRRPRRNPTPRRRRSLRQPRSPRPRRISNLGRQASSTQMLLVVMIAALALAGLIGAMVFRFGRRPAPPYDTKGEWRAPWDPLPAEQRASRPIFASEELPMRRPQAPAPRRTERVQPPAEAAREEPHPASPSSRSRRCWRGSPGARPDSNYFSSWRCRLRTKAVRPVRRSRLSRSALRIDCTSAKASSTFWLTTM